MAIPTYDEFYRSVLEALKDGNVHNSKETIHYCAEVFHLTDQDRQERLPSGGQTVISNRVGWARTYLKKAGLISSPMRGKYAITELGRKALSEKDTVINNEYLSKFDNFRKFYQSTGTVKKKDHSVTNDQTVIESTPQESMSVAYRKISDELADELMTNIMSQSPVFFERLVLDLLKKMGIWGGIEKLF